MITVMANCNFPLMRKHGFPLLVAVLLLLAGSLQAQTTLTLPWTHDFESDATGTTAALPSGWTRINDATGTTNYFPYISSSTINSHSGSNYMYCYMSTSSTYAANAYMVLPAVDRRVEMRDVRLRFWARRSSNPAQLYVGVMGNPSQGSTFVPVDTIDLNTEYTCHTVSFEYYTGSGRNLAFCMRRGSAATYYYVDDIEVFMASCFPVPDNVSAVPQSETSMQLSWHSPGNPRSWKVFYAPTGSTATPDSALFIAFKWYYNSTFYSACIDNIEVSSSITCLAPPLMGTPHDYECVTLMWSGSTDDCEVAITAGPWNSAIVPVATGLTGTSYRFAGLQPATTYTVGVRQRCDSMDVSLWSTAVVTTDSLGCLAPDGLTVAALSNTAATFTWAPRGNETAWDLHVFNTIYDTICTVTATSVSIGDLTAGVTYYAAVRALCGHAQNIEGIWSDTLPFTTQVCPTVTEVVAEEVTFHSVTLSWPAIENAQDYEIVYGVSGFNQGNGTLVTTTTNSFTVTDLLADTSYDFYVRAICGTDWQSENWSPVVTVETPGNPEGVEALSMFDSRISISPNPTDGSTTISVSGINGSVRIDVVDINGRVVRSGRFSISNAQYPTTFDVDNLRQGAYFVHLTGAQVNVVKKLIVR